MGVCDKIYVYDQGSTDGSRAVYESCEKVVVSYSSINDFSNELACKQFLLDKALKENPDADWIFWMDGDTLLDGRLRYDALRDVLGGCSKRYSGCSLGHFNLWRSPIHYRTDNLFDYLDKEGVVSFWRCRGGMKFDLRSGLHHCQTPLNVKPIFRIPYSLIHLGFSTDSQILNKYFNYRGRGQGGWGLDRLLDEKTLTVLEVPPEVLPEWYNISDRTSPLEKELLINKANEDARMAG